MSEKYIDPRCMTDEGNHFVTAEGHWLPCCVLTGHHKEYFNTEEFQVLNNNNFNNKPRYHDWVRKNLLDYDKASGACKSKCGVNNADEEKKFYRSGDDAEFYYRKDSTS
jgi:hypothetical protein